MGLNLNLHLSPKDGELLGSVLDSDNAKTKEKAKICS